MPPFAPRLASWLTLALAALWAVGCGDKVNLSNTSGDANGLLVDGEGTSGFANDRAVIGLGAGVRVGHLSASGQNNEVVAFTNRRPIAVRENVPWTSDIDTIDVGFAPEIAIPVTVWIVRGPFDTQRQKAIDACITTSAIWNSERMGVRFSPFQIVDATGNSNASSYFAFNCSMRAGIERDIGKTAGRINIYYVDTVDGGTGRGQACQIGGDFVAMGRNTGSELLSHELGHDFAAVHIDDLTSDFDQTNIMHSASNTREFITEGQLFRMHVTPASALNAIYNARPGAPTRNCPRDTFDARCPQIRKRIWADGTFSPN